jgi:hypothetical protein
MPHNPRAFGPLDKKSVNLKTAIKPESVNAICLYASTCSVTGFYDFQKSPRDANVTLLKVPKCANNRYTWFHVFFIKSFDTNLLFRRTQYSPFPKYKRSQNINFATFLYKFHFVNMVRNLAYSDSDFTSNKSRVFPFFNSIKYFFFLKKPADSTLLFGRLVFFHSCFF